MKNCYICGIGAGICYSCSVIHDFPLPSQNPPVKKLSEALENVQQKQIAAALAPKGPPKASDVSHVLPFDGTQDDVDDDGTYVMKLEKERVALAQKNGMTVIKCGPKTLSLDFDDGPHQPIWNRFRDHLFPMFFNKFCHKKGSFDTKRPLEVEDLKWWWSKSGEPRRHVLIELNLDLLPMHRVTIQSILGSDQKREMLNMLKCMKHSVTEFLLFMPMNVSSIERPDWETWL